MFKNSVIQRKSRSFTCMHAQYYYIKDILVHESMQYIVTYSQPTVLVGNENLQLSSLFLQHDAASLIW